MMIKDLMQNQYLQNPKIRPYLDPFSEIFLAHI